MYTLLVCALSHLAGARTDAPIIAGRGLTLTATMLILLAPAAATRRGGAASAPPAAAVVLEAPAAAAGVRDVANLLQAANHVHMTHNM
jgi:hypothetical protein